MTRRVRYDRDSRIPKLTRDRERINAVLAEVRAEIARQDAKDAPRQADTGSPNAEAIRANRGRQKPTTGLRREIGKKAKLTPQAIRSRHARIKPQTA